MHQVSSRPARSAERDLLGFRGADALDQERDAVAAPEQFAVEHHGRHAEDAERLGFRDDAVMLLARAFLNIGFEAEAEPPASVMIPAI
jgi:hypothetical protein